MQQMKNWKSSHLKNILFFSFQNFKKYILLTSKKNHNFYNKER